MYRCPFLKNIVERDSVSYHLCIKNVFKNVHMKIFQSIVFFKQFLQQSDNELLVSEMQNKLEVTNFVSAIKCVVHVIQHGRQEFIVQDC